MKNKLNIFGMLLGIVGLILIIVSLFFSLAGQIISNYKLLSGDGWIPYIIKPIVHSLSPAIIPPSVTLFVSSCFHVHLCRMFLLFHRSYLPLRRTSACFYVWCLLHPLIFFLLPYISSVCSFYVFLRRISITSS